MTEKAVVRLATKQDEDQLMDLCRAMHAENGLFSLDEGMVREMLARAWDRQGGLVGVIDGTNEIAAALYLLISHFWYSRDNHLEDIFNYVRPTYRATHHAEDLLAFAKRCEQQIGIPLMLGILTQKRLAAKVRLYRRVFGVPAGAFFIIGGNWNNVDPITDDEIWRERRSPSEKRWRKRTSLEKRLHRRGMLSGE